MGQKTKRILNAFIITFSGTLLLQVADHASDLNKALAESNWVWLRALGLSILGGAFVASIRALQSYVTKVPSPEPDESAP